MSLRNRIVITLMLLSSVLFMPEISYSEEPELQGPFTAYFSSELQVGQNFTWTINEWTGMEEMFNPQSNYRPQPGDKLMLCIIDNLPQLSPEIPRGNEVTSSWNILGWHVENFNFPTLDSKLDSNLSNYMFTDVFGDPNIENKDWEIFTQLFLQPELVKDGAGELHNFSKFHYASLINLHIITEINVSQDALHLQGSIDGKYESVTIDIEGSLGVVEDFQYTRKPIDKTLATGKINITIEESSFKNSTTDEYTDNTNTTSNNYTNTTTNTAIDDPNPFGEISGYPLIFTIGIVNVFILLVKKRKNVLKIRD